MWTNRNVRFELEFKKDDVAFCIFTPRWMASGENPTTQGSVL